MDREQAPAELNDLIESVTTLFWQVKELGEFARQSNGNGEGTDFDTTERRVKQELNNVGLKLMGQYMDSLEHGDCGHTLEADGDSYERKHRTRPCSLLTIFGKLEYSQSIYYSPEPEADPVRPLQQMANLPARKVSYLAQDLIDRLGINDTFVDSRDFYDDFFGHSLSSRTVEQLLGEGVDAYDAYREQAPSLNETAPKQIGVVSFDGKGIPVVPQERTTGKTREALLGCTYTVNPEQRPAFELAMSLTMADYLDAKQKQDLQRQERATDIQYYAELKRDKQTLFEEVAADAQARFAADAVTHQVVLLDGATCLWRLAEEHFQNADYVLDIIHVRSYLRTALTALYPDDKNNVRQTTCSMLKLLLDGGVDSIIKSLEIRLGKAKKVSAKRRDHVQSAITYFTNHRDYMQYDRYLRLGYPIASGVVESACKHIAKDRLDKSGAQWTIDIADAVLKLRTIKANGHWHPYQQIRKQTAKRCLYGTPLPNAA